MSGNPSQIPQESLHVLVADDDPATRSLLGYFLKSEGHTVALAEHGQSALELFELDQAFDLFLIDATMPVMDGLALSEALKERLDRWVPIIMISANIEESAQVEGLDIGADYYLVKPISFPLLRAHVRASQRIARLHRELENTNRKLADYYSRNNSDNDLARQLLDRILQQGQDAAVKASYIINPAGDFSGDMIVSMRTPGQRHYSMIADATGHGLPAAITLMPAVDIFSRLAREGYSLETIVRELNSRLRASLPRGRFVAATIVMIEPHTHRIEIWNGGNPSAYLIDNQRRGILQKFSARHPPLGILPEEEFDGSVRSVATLPDSTFVACTDGVVEAEAPDGSMFGSRGLEDLLVSKSRSDDILAELDQTLTSFASPVSSKDDRTMLVLPLDHLVSNLIEASDIGVEAAPGSRDWRFEGDSSGGWYLAVGVRGDVLQSAELAPLFNGLLSQIGVTGRDAERANVCVTELINNAIDHGVLGLDSSLKQSPNGFEKYFSQRQKRLEQLKEGGVFVRAYLDRVAGIHHMRITVSDSGSGFDVNEIGDNLPHGISAHDQVLAVPHGRGLRLVQRLADKLAFHDGGATSEIHIFVEASCSNEASRHRSKSEIS